MKTYMGKHPKVAHLPATGSTHGGGHHVAKDKKLHRRNSITSGSKKGTMIIEEHNIPKFGL